MKLPPFVNIGAPPPSPLARLGEDAAAAHAESLGWLVLARNARIDRDEADLLALDPSGILVVAEVKTRKHEGYRPEDRVDYHKQRNLIRFARRLSGARQFAARRVRFDVFAVEGLQSGELAVTHFVSAFEA
ncbi:MAG: YraN family protein [Phycisphaerales bacterium]|nr:YraN family protein [Phycisphaerales bacterium]